MNLWDTERNLLVKSSSRKKNQLVNCLLCVQDYWKSNQLPHWNTCEKVTCLLTLQLKAIVCLPKRLCFGSPSWSSGYLHSKDIIMTRTRTIILTGVFCDFRWGNRDLSHLVTSFLEYGWPICLILSPNIYFGRIPDSQFIIIILLNFIYNHVPCSSTGDSYPYTTSYNASLELPALASCYILVAVQDPGIC